MVRIIKDYHIHSKYSKNGHCSNEIEEIVKKAIAKGLKEIAISDHGISHFLYGTSEKNLLKAKEEIEALRIKYPEIQIKLGIEANLTGYDGQTDITEKVAQTCDVIQMGIHYGVRFHGIKDSFVFFVYNFLSRWHLGLRMKMKKKNTEAMVLAMNRYPIQVITHPGDKIPVDIIKLAEIANQKNILLEINNSHRHLSTDELKAIKNETVKFIVGSDAHTYDDIGSFNKAYDRIKAAGVPIHQVVNLEEKQ